LIAFVAGRLAVGKASVSLKSGQTSRRKVIEVIDAPADAARRLLGD
jgi:hypothetical protein